MQDNDVYEAYIIISSKTGMPYIDENNTCHVFTSKRRAEAYVLAKENLIIDGPKYCTLKNLFSQCYAAGANSVSITIKDTKEIMSLIEHRMEPGFYNNPLNQTLSKIKHTKKKKWLKDLKQQNFIMAAKIESDENGVLIYYAVAEKGDENRFVYVAFSDLEEFSIWNSHTKGWQAIKMPYDALWRISRHHGVLINPYGNKFHLKREMMEYIEQEAKNADHEAEKSD